jgi:hypothetical protein
MKDVRLIVDTSSDYFDSLKIEYRKPKNTRLPISHKLRPEPGMGLDVHKWSTDTFIDQSNFVSALFSDGARYLRLVFSRPSGQLVCHL